MPARPALPRGFTLVELMTTLAIASVVAMVAAPALGTLLGRFESNHAAATVAGVLRHARSAAVLHDRRVLVCPSHDGRHCEGHGDWQHGLIVIADDDHDGQPDAGTSPLAVVAPLAIGTHVMTSAGRRTIAFHPNGNAAGSNARFTICHVGQATGESVVVANTGRVRVDAPEPDRLRACLAGVHAE